MSQVYRDEEILEMLRQCKAEHGACTPTNLNSMDDTCSASLVMRRFGSWTDAKEAAGIDEDLSHTTGRKREYEDQDVLSQIRECARRNDGKCTVELLQAESDLVSPSVAIDRFGSWLDAKQEAGLDSERASNKRPQKYSDEDYYELLRACEQKHGKVTQRIFNEDDEFPSAGAVRKRFGRWSTAKEEADIEDTTRSYSDEELLDALQTCASRHGRCTAATFASDSDMPSPETVQRRFGSWSKAKEQAGVN